MFTVLEAVGIACIAVVGLQLCRHVCRLLCYYVIGPMLCKNVDFSKYGRWAVVTGATDGIGKAFAELLAKKGLDIVLISRTLSKLETVAADLEATHKIKTKVIAADFSDPSPEVYNKIEKELATVKPPPLVLINNVGMSSLYPEYFLDTPDKDSLYPKIIFCNILSVTNMTKFLLPCMIEKKKGVIINVSSQSAILPCPMLLVYSATKSYVLKFTKNLAAEYRNSGVVIQSLVTGYVATKMTGIKNSTLMAPFPEHYVEKALRTTGIRQVTTGYFPHSLLVGALQCIESICPQFAAWLVVRRMNDTKKIYLQRQAAM